MFFAMLKICSTISKIGSTWLGSWS